MAGLRKVWWIADGIPILVRVIQRRNFQPGPFQLGRWHLPINLAAIAWVVVSSVRAHASTCSAAALTLH